MSKIDLLIRAARKDKEENNHSIHISELIPYVKRRTLFEREPRTYYCIYVLEFLQDSWRHCE